MQQLTAAVIAALAGGLVLVGGYHVLVVGPLIRRLTGVLEAHDALLGGGASPATARIDGMERSAAAAQAAVDGLVGRIAALERVARSETPRVGFVRYNAFDDVGSDLSYALALVTKDGDGVVLSSIYSREETRTYGKAVERFQAAQDASREERAAILKAKAAAS